MRLNRLSQRLMLAAALALALVAAGAAQAPAADDEAIRKLYNDFFEAFRQGGPVAAIANLRQSGALDLDMIENLERRFARARFPSGRADSYAVVSEMEIPHTRRFRSILFLTHHDGGPVAWRLRFYEKTNGVWVIASVGFEVRFVEDFLLMPQLEFNAYQAMIQLAERAEQQDRENAPRRR